MKNLKKVICAFIIFCMGTGLIACGSASEKNGTDATKNENPTAGGAKTEATPTEAKAADKSYQFIFVSPMVGLEYWDMCASGIAAADAELGTETQIVGGADPNTAFNDMISNIEAAIATKPDGMFSYAGFEAIPPLIDKAVDDGIPFIAIDSDAPDSKRLAYVGTDPHNAGVSSGTAMIEATGGVAKVAVLTSTVTSVKEQTEIEAFKEAVKDYDIEIIATEETNADLNTGIVKMQSLVQTYPEMTAVLCTSGYDIQAAAKIKEEMGLDDLVLIGYDDQEETLKYIRKGVINAIVVQDPYQMGYQAVMLMKKYIDEGKLDQEIYDTGTILVTAENVDNYRD